MGKNACKDCEHCIYMMGWRYCGLPGVSSDGIQQIYDCKTENPDGDCPDFKEKINANIKTESQIEKKKTLESPKKKTTKTQKKTWRNDWFVLHK